jgi:hypothetical protein
MIVGYCYVTMFEFAIRLEAQSAAPEDRRQVAPSRTAFARANGVLSRAITMNFVVPHVLGCSM